MKNTWTREREEFHLILFGEFSLSTLVRYIRTYARDRRRSFHDLQTFSDIEVLTPERMKIDVDICGQLLTMWRREEHLKNVITCTRVRFIFMHLCLLLTVTDFLAHRDCAGQNECRPS